MHLKVGRLFLIGLVVFLVLAGGCINSGVETTHSSSPAGNTQTIAQGTESHQTGVSETSTTSTHAHSLGIKTYRLLNRTVELNASLVPDSVWACSDKAPSVIESYYSAVRGEKNVSGFFDLSVVDEGSLEELHKALYEAVDFKDLKVKNLECFPVSTQLVACKYHYSAVIMKDGQLKGIERNYVTFLSGDKCKIVWTEAEG